MQPTPHTAEGRSGAELRMSTCRLWTHKQRTCQSPQLLQTAWQTSENHTLAKCAHAKSSSEMVPSRSFSETSLMIF